MTRADYIVVTCTLLLLPLLYLNFWGGGPAQAAHIHSADGREFSVPLGVDQTLALEGPLGTSIIEIRNGQVRFSDSPCRGKQCIHAGWLRHGGEFAACLPNRISVTVSAAEPRFDSINF
ncbi:MAG: NusG domain II-containing protein [Gammaproteobacteria bacterium]